MSQSWAARIPDILADQRVDDVVEFRVVTTPGKAYEVANERGGYTLAALATGNPRKVEKFVDLCLRKLVIARRAAGPLGEPHARGL